MNSACNERVVYQIPARRVAQHELTWLVAPYVLNFTFFQANNYSSVIKNACNSVIERSVAEDKVHKA